MARGKALPPAESESYDCNDEQQHQNQGTIRINPPSKQSTIATIFVHDEMETSELSNCVKQVFHTTLSETFDNLAGLYTDDDTFVPLSHVIKNVSAYEKSSLNLHPKKKPKPPPKPSSSSASNSLLQDPLKVAILAATVGLAYYFGLLLQLVEFVVMIPYHFVDLCIETPIRQLYRNGPGLFGWESAPLPAICARITYTGDAEFWNKNFQECEKIYAAKEAAVMLIGKPILYFFFAMLLFTVVHALVKASAVSKPDPDMVSCYKAVKILARQFRGGGGGSGSGSGSGVQAKKRS